MCCAMKDAETFDTSFESLFLLHGVLYTHCGQEYFIAVCTNSAVCLNLICNLHPVQDLHDSRDILDRCHISHSAHVMMC